MGRRAAEGRETATAVAPAAGGGATAVAEVAREAAVTAPGRYRARKWA